VTGRSGTFRATSSPAYERDQDYWALGHWRGVRRLQRKLSELYYDSTQSSTKSKDGIMQSAATSLLGSIGGVNVGLMRYKLRAVPAAWSFCRERHCIRRHRQTNLDQQLGPGCITPLSERSMRLILYCPRGREVRQPALRAQNALRGAPQRSMHERHELQGPKRPPRHLYRLEYNSPATSLQRTTSSI